MRVRRYNPERRGSFCISLDFFDWELSVLIGCLRSTRKEYEQGENPSKAYITFLKRLENKLSRALGDLLKVELKDISLGEVKPLEETVRDGEKAD